MLAHDQMPIEAPAKALTDATEHNLAGIAQKYPAFSRFRHTKHHSVSYAGGSVSTRYGKRASSVSLSNSRQRLTLNAVWFSERCSWIVSDITKLYSGVIRGASLLSARFEFKKYSARRMPLIHRLTGPPC
jgi:hypothetical protein